METVIREPQDFMVVPGTPTVIKCPFPRCPWFTNLVNVLPVYDILTISNTHIKDKHSYG